MPRKTELTFVPPAQSKDLTVLPLDKIPAEVKLEIQEAVNVLKEYPGTMTIEFDTLEEANQYWWQVHSLCQHKGWYVRKSPTARDKPIVKFRVTEKPATETATETETAKETATKATGRGRK